MEKTPRKMKSFFGRTLPWGRSSNHALEPKQVRNSGKPCRVEHGYGLHVEWHQEKPDSAREQDEDTVEDKGQQLGLLCLHPTEHRRCTTNIVAVHGLGGHRRRTWTADNNEFWLEEFLPVDFPSARVYTFGYDSKRTFTRSASTIRDFALGLLDELDNMRQQFEEENIPILFIGHSLGGIVIKQVLNMSSRAGILPPLTIDKALVLGHEQEHRYGSLMRSTTGIVFLGTPHTGSKLADWTRFSRDIIDIAPFGPSIVRAKLFKDLQTNSKVLEDISASFQHRALQLKIVDEQSATLHFPGEEALPIEADHDHICKIPSRENQQYRSIASAVRRQMKEARSEDAGHSPEAAELHLERVKRHTLLRERIKKALQPVSFEEELQERNEFRRCPSTGCWVFDDDRYMSWKEDRTINTLWINGIPGAGKTFLMSTIVEHLSRASRSDDSAILTFFCDKMHQDQSRSLASAILLTILAQILDQSVEVHDSVVEKLLIPFESASSEPDEFQFQKTLLALAQYYKSVVIVVDALDQCEDWRGFVDVAKSVMSKSNGSLKLVVSSRNMDTFREVLTESGEDTTTVSIELDQSLTQADLEQYIRWRVRTLDTRDMGGRDGVVRRLIDGAHGLFILARLRCEALLRSRSRQLEEMEKLIEELPEKLNDFYDLSLQRLAALPTDEKELAGKILVWAMVSPRPIRFNELADLLATVHSATLKRKITITRGELDDIFQGLLTLKADRIELAHSTVHEYLIGIDWTDLGVEVDTETGGEPLTYHTCATMIYAYFRCCFFGPDDWIPTLKEHPFLHHGAFFWPHYTFKATRRESVVSAFLEFATSEGSIHGWRAWKSCRNEDDRRAGDPEGLQMFFSNWLGALPAPQSKRVRQVTGSSIIVYLEERLLGYLRANGKKEDMAWTLGALCEYYCHAGRLEDARRAGEEALEMMTRSSSGAALNAKTSLAMVYSKQGKIMRALEMRKEVYSETMKKHPEPCPDLILATDNLALTYGRAGDLEEAERLGREALEMAVNYFGEEHRTTLNVMSNLAVALFHRRSFDEAIVLGNKTYDLMCKVITPHHPRAIIALDNLARNYVSKGDLDNATSISVKAYRYARGCLGVDHPTTQQVTSNFEIWLADKQRFDQLAQLRYTVLQDHMELYGAEHLKTLEKMDEFLSALIANGKLDIARHMGSYYLSVAVKVYPATSGELRLATDKVMDVYTKLGEHETAASLAQDYLKLCQAAEGPQAGSGVPALHDQMRIHLRLENYGMAAEAGRQAVEITERRLGRYHEETGLVKRDLSMALWKVGDLDEAFNLEVDVYRTFEVVRGPTHQSTIEAIVDIVKGVRKLQERTNSGQPASSQAKIETSSGESERSGSPTLTSAT